MRLSVALLLLVSTVFLVATETTSKRPPSRRPIDPKCQRSRKIQWMRPEGRAKCTYVCKGRPKRIGHAPDGTPCDRRGKQRAPGVCMAGSCVKTEHSMVSVEYAVARDRNSHLQGTGKVL